MKMKLTLTVLIFLCVGIAYFYIDHALSILTVHAPRPHESIQVGREHMRQIDALCERIVPRLQRPLPLITRNLVCNHTARLLPFLFVLAAVSGWCASTWVLAIRTSHDPRIEQWPWFIASGLLSPLSGIIWYLLLWGIPALFGKGDLRVNTAAALPLLSGLFVNIFYDELPGIFRALLQRIAKLLGAAVLVGIVLVLAAPLRADSYYRCAAPKDLCIAFTEKEKTDCPDCSRWQTVFLNFAELLAEAKTEQRRAGVERSQIASNFFLRELAEEFYGIELPVQVTTRTIGSNPERYGLRESTDEPVPGTLAIIGDIAGIAVEHDGKVQIAYPSAKTGKIHFELPEVLADAEDATAIYVVKAPP